MPGVVHAPDEIYRPQRPAGEGPAPSLWEGVGAAFRVAEDTQFTTTQGPRNAQAYSDLLDTLRELGVDTSQNGPLYMDVGMNPLGGVRRGINRDAILAEVARQQARNPAYFKGISTKRADFDKAVANRYGERQKDQAIAARAGLPAQLIGGFGSALTDPMNQISMLASGGQAGLWRTVLQEAAIGAGTELAMLPDSKKAYDLMGEDFTVGDMTQQVLIGAAASGAFGAAGKLGAEYGAPAIGKGWNAVKALPKAAQEAVWAKMIEKVPALQKRMAGKMEWDALDDHLPELVEGLVGRDNLSLQTKIAVDMLRREAEIDAANPFRPDGAGIASHRALFEDHIRRVANDIVELKRPRALTAAGDGPGLMAGTSVSSGVVKVPGKPGQIGFAQDIYQFFKAKGLTDAQARGIAAGIHAESASNHGIRGGYKGRALGLGQWLGERRAEIIRRYGPNPTRQQQLEFLWEELQGRDAGGPKVLRQKDEASVLNSYIVDFMRPAKGAQTTGDLKRGMQALGRGGETMTFREGNQAADPQAVATGPEIDPEAAATADLERRREELEAGQAQLMQQAALDAVRPVVTPSGVRAELQQFSPADIDVDAALMQFKGGGDQFGVTERLRGIAEWDPISAGAVTVWEGLDGRRLIADGHQRLGLAKRMQEAGKGDDIRLNAFVLREADGISAADARIITALKNIAEGSGTLTDAAKIFREGGPMAEDALRGRLPPRSTLVRDGKALARLSDEAFGAVVNEVVPESWGAAIGGLAPDPATHMALIDLLAKFGPPNRRQAESIIRQAIDAGFSRETQEELFGSRDVATALFGQKAKILDRTLGELKKLKDVFRVAGNNAGALEGAGSRIDVAGAKSAADLNAVALDIVDRLALRKGTVGDLFNEAAKRLSQGEPIGRIVADLVEQLRQLDLDAVIREDGGAGRSGDAAGGSGRGGLFDGETQPASGDQFGSDALSPSDFDDAVAAGQAGFFDQPALKQFDEPDGLGRQAAIASMEHDLRALAADQSEAMFDLGDGLGSRAARDIFAELDELGTDIDTIKGCL